MRVFDFIVFLFLFVALGLSFYALWLNLPQESRTFEPLSASGQNYDINASNEIVQF